MKVQYFHGLQVVDPNKPIEVDPTQKLLAQIFEFAHGFQYDYFFHWKKDKFRDFLSTHSYLCQNIDVFVGNSFGGYIAFILAQYFNKPVIMINPALNRNFSVTGIYEADFDYLIRRIPIYMYLGYLDTTVNPLVTLNYLADKGYNDIRLEWGRSTHIVHLDVLEPFFNWVNKDLKGE